MRPSYLYIPIFIAAYIYNIFWSLDILGNAIIGGSRLTISADCWSAYTQDRLWGKIVRPIIDGIFRMFGERGTGDAGTDDITMSRASKTFSMPADAILSDMEGFVRYKGIDFPTTFDITLEYEGLNLKDQPSTITIEAPANGDYYNADTFYSGDGHYNHIFTQRLSQERVSISGQSSQFRVKVTHSGKEDLEISEIGFKFKTSS